MLKIRLYDDREWESGFGADGKKAVDPQEHFQRMIVYSDLQFALAAVSLSQKGEYTAYAPAGTKVWEVLGKMPFDILVAVRISNIKNLYQGKIYYEDGCSIQSDYGIRKAEFQI